VSGDVLLGFGQMNESKSLLQDLNDAVARGSAESRLRALWHATDLLITGRYDEDQIWIFGEVIGQLATEIESAARAKLAEKLAEVSNAPRNIITRLSDDESIDVAGPILRRSERLDVRALVANASSKSQQHLLAISKREILSEEVTDVLVTRGDQRVVRSVAANQGARFSEFGFWHLVKRSEGDSILAETLGQRRDIPRNVFQQLIAKAADEVKGKLEREHPELLGHIQASVTNATGAMHSKFGPASKGFFSAKKLVSKLHQFGELTESKLFDYAQSHKFDEAMIALSLLCSLPVDIVERALFDKNKEMVLVFAKAAKFSWSTTMSLLFLGAPNHRISAQELDALSDEFSRLNTEASQSVLSFYRSRKHAAGAGSKPHRLPQLYVV
jgi:uncharacterized protein (DUF2336 family)